MARRDAGNQHRVEESSSAKLTVLERVAAGLSQPETGAELRVSLNAVKTPHPASRSTAGRNITVEQLPAQMRPALPDLTESPG
jgi:hypothetical protein